MSLGCLPPSLRYSFTGVALGGIYRLFWVRVCALEVGGHILVDCNVREIVGTSSSLMVVHGTRR